MNEKEEEKNLTHAITVFVFENGGVWNGRLGRLADCLELGTVKSKSMLMKRLKKCREGLKEAGITAKITGDEISFEKRENEETRTTKKQVSRRISTCNAMLSCKATKDTKKGISSSKTKELILFPFEWLYGTVIKLSEEEKKKLDLPIGNGKGHKKQKKHCQLCGLPKPIEYRKTSDGNSSVICRDCAVPVSYTHLTLPTTPYV